MAADLLAQDAVELTARIRAGVLRPSDLMRATLDRIAALNPAHTAIVSLKDRESLMGAARIADAMPAEGPLHGLPMAIKDLVAVKGIRSTWGSPLRADNIPDTDDGLARRLRAAGAILIGKTNVPQFGLGSHSTNPLFGVTRNPYDPTRTAGGSSGGAGAAIALGMLACADGSDMMGSLRNPAAWNNIYALRPTVGLIPGEHRNAAFVNRLSTNGPMARSIRDLALLMEVLSDGAYRAAKPVRMPQAPRLGWLGDWGGALPMEDGILAQSQVALEAMRALGWRIDDLPPPVAAGDLWTSWRDLRALSVTMDRAEDYHDPERRAHLNPQMIWEVEHGLALSGADVARAVALREGWLARLEALFAEYDALILPSTQVWPFPAEWDWPREIAGQEMDTYHRWMEVVVPASLAGVPALALPAGFGAAGLPAGVQVIGPAGSDARLLAMGQAYHEATDWPGRNPPVQ